MLIVKQSSFLIPKIVVVDIDPCHFRSLSLSFFLYLSFSLSLSLPLSFSLSHTLALSFFFFLSRIKESFWLIGRLIERTKGTAEKAIINFSLYLMTKTIRLVEFIGDVTNARCDILVTSLRHPCDILETSKRFYY